MLEINTSIELVLVSFFAAEPLLSIYTTHSLPEPFHNVFLVRQDFIHISSRELLARMNQAEPLLEAEGGPQ